MSNTQSTLSRLLSRRRLIACALAAVPSFGSNPQVQFVFGTYGTKSLSPQKALAAIAATGYDGIELCLIPGYQTDAATFSPEAVRDYRELLLRHELSVPALLDNLPLFGAKEKSPATLERLRRIAEIAHGLSPDVPPVLDTVLGGKTEDWNEQRDRVIDDLRSWARIAEQSAFTIAVKPHADQALNSPDRALQLLRAVDSKRIRVVYDYSHFRLEGFTLEDSLQRLFSSTALISLKDSTGTGGSHQYLLPGDGDTDYPRYFRLLAKLGYQGAIGVEVSSMLHRRPDYDPVQTAQLCYQRLAAQFKAAGLARPRQPRTR